MATKKRSTRRTATHPANRAAKGAVKHAVKHAVKRGAGPTRHASKHASEHGSTHASKHGSTHASNAGARARGASGDLVEYRRKRDFAKTAEPAGRAASARRARAARAFVIQKHAASHLHFDLRLELDGVMKSWAVPKGPSYDPAVRRLAMEVEDHPIEYNAFEGTIPKGEYGGGTVMIWDRGTYDAENGGGADALRDGYARGDLKFTMHGRRMRGGWVLVRMRRDDAGRAQWLLIKHRDEFARPDYDVVAEETTSVVSGREMDEIAAKSRRVWSSSR